MRGKLFIVLTAVISLVLTGNALAGVKWGGKIQTRYIGTDKKDDTDEKVPNKMAARDINVTVGAKLNEHVEVSLVLKEHNLPTSSPIDTARITLKGFEGVPGMFVTTGKGRMPFGTFNSHLVSDAITKNRRWDTNRVGVICGYKGEAGKIQGAIYDQSNGEDDPGAFAAQAILGPFRGFSFGCSYKSEPQVEADTTASSYADVHGMINYVVGPVTIDGEYCAASTRGEDPDSGDEEPRPSALSVGLAWQATPIFELAARSDSWNDDVEGDQKGQVKSRVAGGCNIKIFEKATLSLEYLSNQVEVGDNWNNYYARLSVGFP